MDCRLAQMMRWNIPVIRVTRNTLGWVSVGYGTSGRFGVIRRIKGTELARMVSVKSESQTRGEVESFCGA
jgi:hypothetical protein